MSQPGTPQQVTRAEYARMKGWNRSTVTRFAEQGRVVIVDDLVDVAASEARLAQTAEPSKAGVAERHANERGQQPIGLSPDLAGDSYQKARAIKEKYLALQAKADYERSMGQLLPRADVEQALADVVAYARSSLENLPHRCAGNLVGKDFEQILATLKSEIITLMGEMHSDASRQLANLTEPTK